MTEQDKPKLVRDVLANRAQAKADQQARLEAQALIPGFRDTLTDLLRAKFDPLPNDIPRDVFDAMPHEERVAIVVSRLGAKPSVELHCVVPSADGVVIEAVIKSDQYPTHHSEMVDAEYTVDVKERDSLLKLKRNKAVIESRSIHIPEFNEYTPIGVELPSRPVSSTEANVEDLQDYQKFVAHMTQAETVYTPHSYTPHRSGR